MRLISKFHDYYDTAIGYGVDPNVIFVRKTDDCSSKDSPYPRMIDEIYPEKPYDKYVFNIHGFNVAVGTRHLANVFVVLFCGKVHMGIKLEYYDSYAMETIHEYCYDLKQVKKFFKTYKLELPKKPNKKRWYRKRIRKKNLPLMCEKGLKKFFAENASYPLDLHFKLDAPIILIQTSGRPVINPVLKDIDFYKKVDAFTAFQEISMFISGVMGGKSPAMVEISDADRLSMHGFDEWSFRKMSEKNNR